MSVGVVEACYQGIMGHKAAEERLREVGADSYLTRESDIKKGKFVLSFLSKTGAVKHSVLRNPAFRKEFKTIKEGSEVMEKMILTNDECVHQVPLRVRVAELEEQIRILSLGQASSS